MSKGPSLLITYCTSSDYSTLHDPEATPTTGRRASQAHRTPRSPVQQHLRHNGRDDRFFIIFF